MFSAVNSRELRVVIHEMRLSPVIRTVKVKNCLHWGGAHRIKQALRAAYEPAGWGAEKTGANMRHVRSERGLWSEGRCSAPLLLNNFFENLENGVIL